MLQKELLYALLGTGATFLATALGAAMVFFFKKDMGNKMQKIFLGFAAGVMIAAAVWSLLIPSIETALSQGQNAGLTVGVGFALGMLFLMGCDKLLPHLHLGEPHPEGLPCRLKRTTMLTLAVTLHNVPEGMAVGLAFAAAAQGDAGTFSGAIALAIGMGLQNFPEGAAISLPLRSEGMKRSKAFFCGMLSGIVEPIFGILTVLIAGTVTGILPWLLAFAASAMLYVVVEELIPEAHLGEHSHIGSVSVMTGFLIMMLLDVFLG